MSALLHVEQVGKRFGGFVALDSIDVGGDDSSMSAASISN